MLTIHIENIDDLAVVECKGRIVRSDAAFALREAVTSQTDARIILLDLSGLSTIAGGGLGMLVFLQRWAYDHDIRLKIFNPTRPVLERIEMANSIPGFEIATVEEMRAIVAGGHGR